MNDYSEQLNNKINYLKEKLSAFGLPELAVFASEPTHYRQRAEFRIWHDGDEMNYAMFQAGQKASSQSLIKLTQFPIASQKINDLMPKLMAEMAHDPILRERWYQVEFLGTLSGEMLVTLIYHRRLDENWVAAAEKLQEKLGIWIIGRSRGQKVVLTQDFVTERLNVNGREWVYRQLEGGFTQPNAKMCEKMLSWAVSVVENNPNRDLLELYCGNGNFTLPLSRQFRRVLATEVSKTSVQAAQWSIQENQIDNIQIARLSAEECTAVWSGSLKMRRLAEQGIDFQDYDFSTIFIDPPRAGVDSETLKWVAQFEQIVYVSCNPETLYENLVYLNQTHEIVQCALFDQFPFTPHIESGVFLRKKS